MLVQDDIAIVGVVVVVPLLHALPSFELNAAFSDGFIATGTSSVIAERTFFLCH